MTVHPIFIECEEDYLPQYSTKEASGADLRACIEAPYILQPFQRALIPTGVRLSLPQGLEAQVRPRSGLAWNEGLTVLNTPGTIDSDYRGEIKVILINLGSQPIIIEPKMRIAQIIFVPTLRVEFQRNSSPLSSTERDKGGFGHTGTH